LQKTSIIRDMKERGMRERILDELNGTAMSRSELQEKLGVDPERNRKEYLNYVAELDELTQESNGRNGKKRELNIAINRRLEPDGGLYHTGILMFYTGLIRQDLLKKEG